MQSASSVQSSNSVKTNNSSIPETSNGYRSRDPRLQSSTLNPTMDAKRSAFLSGSLKADELLKGTVRVNPAVQPKRIKDIRTHISDIQKTISSQPSSFYARLPEVPVAPSGSRDNRSPFISNNHSAHFPSQSSSESIRATLEARRFRNVSASNEQLALQVGADLDSISQSIQPAVQDSQTCYSDNNRSISTQTNPVAIEVTKTCATVGTQTTANDGTFTIWNLSDLTGTQRKALQDLKKVSEEFKITLK
jgi:hypothetical protein